MEVTHNTNNLAIAPRKMRLVADGMRYKTAAEAIALLPLLPQKAAGLMYKALKSAIVMAKDNDLDVDTLVIQRVWANEGRVLKRSVSHSRGRMAPIMKRASHLSIVLSGQLVAKRGASKKEAALVQESTPAQEQE